MNELTEKDRKRIESEYNKLESMDYSEKKGDINCYVCPHCGLLRKTINADSGVTPFMIKCDLCGWMMESTFYAAQDISPELEPTHEWYRPSLEETLEASDGVRMHILNGGLMSRRIFF